MSGRRERSIRGGPGHSPVRHRRMEGGSVRPAEIVKNVIFSGETSTGRLSFNWRKLPSGLSDEWHPRKKKRTPEISRRARGEGGNGIRVTIIGKEHYFVPVKKAGNSKDEKEGGDKTQYRNGGKGTRRRSPLKVKPSRTNGARNQKGRNTKKPDVL